MSNGTSFNNISLITLHDPTYYNPFDEFTHTLSIPSFTLSPYRCLFLKFASLFLSFRHSSTHSYTLSLSPTFKVYISPSVSTYLCFPLARYMSTNLSPSLSKQPIIYITGQFSFEYLYYSFHFKIVQCNRYLS